MSGVGLDELYVEGTSPLLVTPGGSWLCWRGILTELPLPCELGIWGSFGGVTNVLQGETWTDS